MDETRQHKIVVGVNKAKLIAALYRKAKVSPNPSETAKLANELLGSMHKIDDELTRVMQEMARDDSNGGGSEATSGWA